MGWARMRRSVTVEDWSADATNREGKIGVGGGQTVYRRGGSRDVPEQRELKTLSGPKAPGDSNETRADRTANVGWHNPRRVRHKGAGGGAFGRERQGEVGCWGRDEGTSVGVVGGSRGWIRRSKRKEIGKWYQAGTFRGNRKKREEKRRKEEEGEKSDRKWMERQLNAADHIEIMKLVIDNGGISQHSVVLTPAAQPRAFPAVRRSSERRRQTQDLRWHSPGNQSRIAAALPVCFSDAAVTANHSPSSQLYAP
nr:hypothetical protein Iba_chr10fCG0470 [Ipomoea batatas]